MENTQLPLEKSEPPPRKISEGSIVIYQEVHYRVTRLTKETVNLGTIFGKRVIHKGVSLSEVREDSEAWYKYWEQSDTYRCM